MSHDHRTDDPEPEEGRRFRPIEWVLWCNVSWTQPLTGKAQCKKCGMVDALLPHWYDPPWNDDYLGWLVDSASKLEASGWLATDTRVDILCPNCRPAATN
jgi:hypothetical protein